MANQLHKIFMNPHHEGDVRFQGTVYEGRHEPIVDSNIWRKVKDVMASHVVGEKVRDHLHDLKSSVFCGNCGSRLIVHHAANRPLDCHLDGVIPADLYAAEQSGFSLQLSWSRILESNFWCTEARC